MIYNKKKIRIFIVILIILVLLAVSVYLYFRLNKRQVQPVLLTEQEKIQTLNKLSEGADTSPVGIKKQEEILKKLNGGKTESKPLTDEERQKIMDSFNNL